MPYVMHFIKNISGGHRVKKSGNNLVQILYEHLWNLPHCVGAIDSKHVVIQAPASSGSSFYISTFSIVLLAVCDARYCFTLLDIGNYGRHSDGGVLANSAFGQAMERGSLSLPNPEPLTGQRSPVPYFFVGDSTFPLKTYMLRPHPGKFLPENKQIFNNIIAYLELAELLRTPSELWQPNFGGRLLLIQPRQPR